METSEPFGSGPREGLTIWKIAVGVCLGSLVASAITWGVAELRVRWEIQQAAHALQNQTVRAQEAHSSAQSNAALDALRAAKDQSQLELQQREELLRQQREESDRIRARQEEAEKREAAWKRFYRPSAGCAASTVSIECANEHIRAKKEFEAKYGTGQL